MRKTTILGLTAGGLTILSTFLPIFKVEFLGISKSITVWDGVKMQDDNGAAIMILVMALLGALFAFLANKKHLASIGSLIMFALITLIAFVWHGDIPEMASAGFGLYLMMIAGLLGIVSSVLGFMKK